MFLNLTTASTEILNRLKTNSALVSTTRIAQWLNQAQDDICNEFDFPSLGLSVDVATVIGRRQYYAPLMANRKIRSITNITQDQPMDEKSKACLLVFDPSEQDEGTPYYYAIEGMGYKRSAHGSGTVDIVSSSAADTSQKVRIQGRDSNDIDRTELLTLNGTSVMTGAITFAEVYSVTKDNTTTGIITVNMNDADNTVIARFSPDLQVDETAPFYVYPTPTAVETMRVQGFRRPRKMVNDQDFPDIPSEFHELVLIGGVIRGHKDLFRFNLAQDVFEKEFLPKLAQLRKSQNIKSRQSPVIIGMFKDYYNSFGNLPPEFGA